MARRIAAALPLFILAGSAAFARSHSSPASVGAFGQVSQTMTLGAPEFRAADDATLRYAGAGYVYRNGGTTQGIWAPVNLPNGAVVEHVCVQLYDTNLALDASVDWGLYELGSSSALPSLVTISSATDNYSNGYHIFCVPDVPHTVHSQADFDGDGHSNFGACRILVNIPAADNSIRLGGAWLSYHLDVSPAPAVATFTDVPVDHPFFRYVEALSKAGITACCNVNPPEFCPDEPLTRGQMAVFLSVALGLHFPN